MNREDYLCRFCLESEKGTGCSGGRCDGLGHGEDPLAETVFLHFPCFFYVQGIVAPCAGGVTALPHHFGLDPLQ